MTIRDKPHIEKVKDLGYMYENDFHTWFTNDLEQNLLALNSKDAFLWTKSSNYFESITDLNCRQILSSHSNVTYGLF